MIQVDFRIFFQMGVETQPRNQISWKPCGFFNEAHGPR